MAVGSSRIAPEGETQRLRADARYNRSRIVTAAREAFAARGLDVPMAAIARRAGVGVATLYRHFPSRESLITEVFADQLTMCVSVVDDALADPDPWRGFQMAIEKVCAMQVVDRGFTAAFLTAFPEAVDFERERSRAEQKLTEVIRRAQKAGRLRTDFHLSDVALIFTAHAGIANLPPETALAASRRLVAFLLKACRAESAGDSRPLPPPAPLSLRHLGHAEAPHTFSS
jgi:AcrR family transcriptional regulator